MKTKERTFSRFSGVTITFCAVTLFTAQIGEAQVYLGSSSLPIIIIDTGGLAVLDEPKIMVRMSAIDNGPGIRNAVTDPPNAYDGFVGIEFRGSSSLTLFPKKSYAVETRNADESNRNVALLGLPTENDWVLHGPYSDKSLLRNVVAFYLARSTGRYASRWRFVELIVNGGYEGVYVLLERVKRDNDRIDISPLEPTDVSGDALTGGYILKIDKTDGAQVDGWYSSYPSSTDQTSFPFYQYHYPRPSSISTEQKQYIRDVIDHFEDVMESDEFDNPEIGYPALLDVDALVDYVLLTEVSHNVDGYRLSTFFYKDRDTIDGRIVMGPAWDFNLAFGNANYFDGGSTAGFRLRYEVPQTDPFHVPFWWRRFLEDPGFVHRLTTRWDELRNGPLATDSIMAFVQSSADLLSDAHQRNFQRWPVLDQWIWPNVVVEGSYSGEVEYLKSWLSDRLAWLDDNLASMAGTSIGSPVPHDGRNPVIRVYPNPARHRLTASISVPDRSGRVNVRIYDVAGRRVGVLASRFTTKPETFDIEFETAELSDGVYFVRVDAASGLAVVPVTIVR